MRYLFKMNRAKNIIALLILIFTLSVAVACSKDTTENISITSPKEVSGDAPRALKVVTTVSPITSLVENIGGTKISLEGIIEILRRQAQCLLIGVFSAADGITS